MKASTHFLMIVLFLSTVFHVDAVRKQSGYKAPKNNYKRTLQAKKEKEHGHKPGEVCTDPSHLHAKPVAKRGAKIFTEMNYDELVIAREGQQKSKNMDAVIKYTERMLKLCDDIEKTAEHMIELADLLYDNGETKKAGTLYAEFSKLYPGNAKTEYALHRAINCSFYNTLSHDRDQQPTHETIQLADDFLSRTTFKEYRKQVLDIRLQCYQRVVQSELNVCDFYLKSRKPKVVERRLNRIRSEWLAKIPEMESDILSYELRLAQLNGDTESINLVKEKIKEKDPLLVAQANAAQVSFRNRF